MIYLNYLRRIIFNICLLATVYKVCEGLAEKVTGLVMVRVFRANINMLEMSAGQVEQLVLHLFVGRLLCTLMLLIASIFISLHFCAVDF